jgi:predicted MFS family arabinose efflux permease
MPAPNKWDTGYEWKAVTLLGIGFGLVGLDRWIIAPLFPFMMKDLSLGYQDLGNLIGILGVCWGIFAVVMGGVSDRIGHRKVLIPAIVVFSLLSGVSGLATGFASLLLIRAIMGFSEGSFCPTSFAAIADASEPKRRGFNLGVQQSAFPLFGLGLGPIIATQLLRVVPSWRWVFLTVSIPGFILAIFMYRILREPAHLSGHGDSPRVRWLEIFRSRNVLLAMFALLCAMTGIFVLSAMLPNYLIDYLHLTGPQMGFVMSAIGFGGFLGQMVVPGLSDIFGRKIIAILGFLAAAVSLYVFTLIGANPLLLFAVLFVATHFCLGLLGLLTGPIATESAPAGLVSSAIGIVVGAGEIFGGGIAPSFAGYIEQHNGIQDTLYLALSGLTTGIFVCLFLKETAPRKVLPRAEGVLAFESRAGR